MTAELLKHLAPHCTIETKSENEDYGFSIKIAKESSWNYFIVFTDGLANHVQHIPQLFDKLKNVNDKGGDLEQALNQVSKYTPFQRIELYFCLPDYWDFEAEPWPLKWLNFLAEIPQKKNSWYGPGDTIPAGNPIEIISQRFEANHFMLIEPLKLKGLLSDPIFSQNKIQFLGIVPILQVELEYKLRNSATVLLARLEKQGYTEQIDLFRQAVCRKRFLNLF